MLLLFLSINVIIYSNKSIHLMIRITLSYKEIKRTERNTYKENQLTIDTDINENLIICFPQNQLTFAKL